MGSNFEFNAEEEFAEIRKFYELEAKKGGDDKKTFQIPCDVRSCSRAPKGTILVPGELWQGMTLLCGRLKTEWIGYLTGEIEGETALLEELYFPPQDPSGAHVEPVGKFPIKPRTIASIHSHVSMAARFSQTDKDHANWPIEIVINNKGDYEASFRLKLPCGEFIRSEAQVQIVSPTIDPLTDEVAKAILEGKTIRSEERKAIVTIYPSTKPTDYPKQGSLMETWYPKKDKRIKPVCQVHGCRNRAKVGNFCRPCWKEFGS